MKTAEKLPTGQAKPVKSVSSTESVKTGAMAVLEMTDFTGAAATRRV